jgi:hypothetical protein
MQWNIGASAAMSLDTSGNLGIGTASPAAPLDVYTTGNTTLRISGSSGGGGSVSQIDFFRIGSNVTSSIVAIRDGSNTSGALTFYTAASGTNTERARISSAGVLSLGDTGTVASSFSGVKFNGASYNGLGLNDSSSTSAVGFVYFQIGGTTIGSITRVAATSAVAYNTVSDQRLKTNIVDAAQASTLIDAIQVRQYDWKSDGSHQRYGFIAQELVTVAPEAVHQPADPEAMMAVDYSKLVPMLVKEIQSLRARVAQLESK